FLRQLRFGADLSPIERHYQHLFSTGTLTDGSEHHRLYWVLGTADFSRLPVAYPWIITKKIAVPYGLMLAFDGGSVWGVHRTATHGQKQLYELFAMPRPDPARPASALPDFAKRPASPRAAGTSWARPLNLRPRALIRAAGNLVLAGIDANIPAGPVTPAEAGLLYVTSAATGELIGRTKLPSPPVWTGLAAAGGRVIVSLMDGSVVCLGAEASGDRSGTSPARPTQVAFEE
ncbi:MAG: PQQ-binding-like beta-propeller repeat protein, partial [Planctomycetes bacterium]|nr:PQQ-binding-like beta-propeller repeat protein [Planctomycetota bacterium]